MSPKWILRHKLATSTIEELAQGSFQTVLADSEMEPAKVKRVILCSGKVYYHLYEERQAREIDNIAIIRIEQLYPFDDNALIQALAPYKKLKDVIWCQEEPINQGVWYSSQHHMRKSLAVHDARLQLSYVGREASAAPAGGYMSVHIEEQNRFINEALTLAK